MSVKRLFLFFLLLAPGIGLAQPFTVPWYKIAGGGGVSAGGAFSVSGTIGQGDASSSGLSGGAFSVSGGYWPGFGLDLESEFDVTSITSTPSTHDYKAGDVVPITVTFSGEVAVTGSPQLSLSDGGTAVYASGGESSALTFNYTVGNGDTSSHLDYAGTNALTLNGGTITAGGLPIGLELPAPGADGSLSANTMLIVDTTAPAITISAPSVEATTNGAGSSISYSVTYFDANFNSATLVAGNVTLTNPSVTGAISVAQVNSTNYTVTISDLAGLGPQAIAIASGTATDFAGNPAPAATASRFKVMTVPIFTGDSIIANVPYYFRAGEILLVHTNGVQELLNTELHDSYTTTFDQNGDILVACFGTPASGDSNTSLDGGIFKLNQYTLELSEISGYTNFVVPLALAVEPDGHILVADSWGNTDKDGAIFRVDPVSGVASVLSENSPSMGTNFYNIGGLAIATNGGGETILVSDQGDGSTLLPKVIQIDPSSGRQTVLVSGSPIQQPCGIAIDPSGSSVTNLYVADAKAATLVQIGNTTGSWVATSIATTPANSLHFPTHVAIDTVSDSILVTDAAPELPGNSTAGSLWRMSRSGFGIQSVASGGFFEQPRGIVIRP